MADEPASKPEVTKDTAPAPTETPAVPTQATQATPATTGVESAKSSNKNLFIILAVIALIAGGAYFKNQQDNKNAERAAENLIKNLGGGDIDIDAKDNSFSIKDESGSMTIESGQKLPDDFPKDSIPYLDEKKVSLVFSNTTDGKKSWSVSTTVDKSIEEAVAFFESKIVEPDYMDIGTYGYNESTTFSANTAEYGIYITVGNSDSDTEKDTTVTYVINQN